MTDDSTLLRRYAENRSESDFAELVRRHLNLVYSAALRQVNGDAHLAEDVTQVVFTDLARQAGKLARHRVLAGWLFTSTRFAASKLIRAARRRRTREQEALIMQADSASDPTAQVDWDRIRPILDDAMGELDERDREAILLRYLGGCAYAEVGARLALSENAARMCVDRAVEKLRVLLARRGATSTAAALALALASQGVMAAPAGLAATVTGAALAGGTAATLTFMSPTKLQLGLAGAILAAGAGIYSVQEQHNAALRAELAGAPVANREIARLRQENQQLERAARRTADLKVSDAELARLKHEVAVRQQRLEAMTRPVPPPPSPPAVSVPPTGPTYAVGELDQKPKAIKMKSPVYPFEMLAAGTEGKVVVSFVIDAAGKVHDVQTVSATNPEFAAAAIAAVRQWQFDPGLHGGRKVNTRANQLLVFQNNDEPPGNWF